MRFVWIVSRGWDDEWPTEAFISLDAAKRSIGRLPTKRQRSDLTYERLSQEWVDDGAGGAFIVDQHLTIYRVPVLR